MGKGILKPNAYLCNNALSDWDSGSWLLATGRPAKRHWRWDAILNRKTTHVICIYCAIGQRGDAVAKVIGAVIEDGPALPV